MSVAAAANLILAISMHVVSYDIWFYLTHILLHQQRVIHVKHHKKLYHTIYFTDTNRAHWIENVVQPLGILLPCIGHWNVIAFMSASLIVGVRGAMHHDPRCSWIVGDHHLLHHKDPRYNFGEYWLDWMCGTLNPGEKVHGINIRFD
jgi:hypothetical protein